MIGDQVTLTVLGVHGRQVRVGIAAPKTIPVHRQEVFERIQREAEATATAEIGDERDRVV